MNVEHIISAGGLLAITAIVFAESGLLVGFFLPGDTLLFTAGIAASQGQLPIVLLLICITVAAIAGDNVGYTFGRRMGKRLFTKKDGLIFRHEHIQKAEKFYENHGGKTIILARFIPAVRTFAPIVAGAGKMPRRDFMFYNVIGALIWALSVTLLGYWLGERIPNLDKYIEYVLLGGILIAVIPSVWHILRDKRIRSFLVDKIRSIELKK